MITTLAIGAVETCIAYRKSESVYVRWSTAHRSHVIRQTIISCNDNMVRSALGEMWNNVVTMAHSDGEGSCVAGWKQSVAGPLGWCAAPQPKTGSASTFWELL